MILAAVLLGILLGAGLSWLYHREARQTAEKRIAELDAERKLFLDHLARAGFGVPIFAPVTMTAEQEAAKEEPAKPLTLEEEEEYALNRVRGNPAKMAAVVTSIFRKRARNAKMDKRTLTPEQQQAALDEIERVEKEASA